MVSTTEDLDPAEEHSEQDHEIIARLTRRIRGARANLSSSYLHHDYLVSPQEDFWERHLKSLVTDALALGVARAKGLAPFGELMSEMFGTTRFLLAGYLQLAGHVNNLALTSWLPTSPRTVPKIRALVQLHARALVITEEVFVLSTMGYPSGAISLARTLHEVRVTAKFLHRFESKLSERYLASHIVDLWKSRAEIGPTGAARRSKAWLDVERELQRRFEEVIARHGQSMLIENGWALPRFARRSRRTTPPQRIPFARLEEQVRQPWDRARYRVASRQVHASQLGNISTLQANEEGTVLLGPRPFDLDRAAIQAMWDVQDVAESLLRSCGRFVDDGAIYYWLEALDQLSFVIRHSIADGQEILDGIFDSPARGEETRITDLD